MPPQTIKIDPASIQPISDVKIDPNSITPLDDLKQAPSQQFADHPGEYLENAGIGALKGAGHTASAIGRVLFPDWAAKMAGMTPPNEAQHESYYAPKNDAQGMGRALEQIGEFFIPGPAEEAGAAKLAELMPKAGKFADPLAHVLTSAASSGAMNAAQGGSPLVGAGMGAGGRLIAEGAKASAPALMEWAQGIKTPGSKTGKAILEETNSVLPAGVRTKAQKVLNVLNPELEEVTNQSPARVSMAPVREEAGKQISKAQAENNPRMVKGIKKMANQLMERKFEPTLGAEGPSATLPIPDDVSAREYLDLKRGVGKAQPQGSWSPESSNAFKGPRNAIYGKMANDFHAAVPEAAPLDKRISALIPATKRGTHAFGHAWGPGAGAMIGGFYGARPGIREGNPESALVGGLQGALEGGAAGFAMPMFANAVARAAASPVLPRVILPAATGAVLQTTRRKP